MELVPLVHDLIQIHSIYVFCTNKPKHELWAKDYRKVHGVFTDIKEVCECLKTYFISQTSSEYEQLQLDLLNKDITLPIKDKLDISFIYPLLSKKILFNMKSIKQEDMINYCRMEYISEYQIHIINEFQINYLQHKPIWWFTRDRFFQGIINRALQIHDFYTLCTMNPYIKDLDKQLTDLYQQQITLAPKILYLYLSQSISINDFEKLKLNIGGLMCINQFLFANTEQAIALLFIENQNSISIDTNNINVLFEIAISKTIEPNASYANVGSISEFVHEKEYLLSMSSIFRVEKIGVLKEIPSIWCIYITLIDKNDPNLSNLTQIINTEYLYKNNDLSEFGSNITNKLYQFKSTRKLFEQTLNSRAKFIRPILLHYNMGIIYDCLNNYQKAIEQYTFAIKLTRSCVPNGQQKDILCLVPFYSNLGLSYQHDNRCKEAFEHSFRTLGILSQDGANSIFKKELSASSHFNLGLILDLQNKIDEAKPHYQRALKLRREYLPNNHPDIIILQDIIISLSSSVQNESIH
jgi:tetratricopeptide (TPR) repeat protein